MVFLLAACSADSEEKDGGNDSGEAVAGGELRVAFPSEPPNLDTHLNTASVASIIGRNIFETLLTFDAEGAVQPMLAESYVVSDDGKTIDFKLREGVHFHNGEEMTAKDVVASMNRWIEFSSSGKETFNGAVFEEVDKYEVQLVMAEPTSTATLVLGYTGAISPSIMPASIIEESKSEIVKEFIGTGPFEFEEWKQNQHIHLKKFDDYSSRDEPADGLAGKKEALVDDLYILFVPDSSTRIAGVLSGEYDAIMELPIDNAEQILGSKDVEMYSVPKEILLLYFNKKEGLFANEVAREALAVGINKEEILHAAFVNPEYYDKTHHVMLANQESQWNTDVGKDEYDFQDIELSKELFEEAGYNGEEIRLLTSRDLVPMYNAAIVVQEQLKNVGIDVTLEVADWPTYNELGLDPSAYEITVIANKGKAEPTSLAWARTDYFGFTDSPELDEITNKIRRAPSLDEAKGLYDELSEWFLDYRPAVKIGDGDMLYAARNTVSKIDDIDGLILWNVSNSK